ncbi:hypothetical protein KA107_01685 [Candidatus Pacearchaeota archaeon]|nr:hypothetical protein [Candidatus Pacearchaeota archaeon]
MGLKRNHKGIEGFFYKSGNKKLVAQPAIIEKVEHVQEETGGPWALRLYFIKRGGSSSTWDITSSLGDVKDFLKGYGVISCREFNRLPLQERLALIYNHDGMNYGVSIPRG